LDDHESAIGLDRTNPGRPVDPCPREDDRDGPIRLILCQGAEENIDCGLGVGQIPGRPQLKRPILDLQQVGRGDHVDMTGFDLQTVPGREDREGGAPGQQIREGAGLVRVQMLHQHKGDVAVGRQMTEELFERTQRPGRRSDTDHRSAQAWISFVVPALFLRFVHTRDLASNSLSNRRSFIRALRLTNLCFSQNSKYTRIV
jgi:hypothetical protein